VIDRDMPTGAPAVHLHDNLNMKNLLRRLRTILSDKATK
jgi:hypothetical protein